MIPTHPFSAPHRPIPPTVAVDFDGTLTTGQAWKEMRDYLIAHGQGRIARLFMLRQVPRFLLFRLGLIDGPNFKERWALGSLRLFEGFSLQEFEQMAEWVVEQELWPRRSQEVLNELEEHKAAGRQIIIVSGLFEPIINAFVRRLEGYQAIGTPVAFENKRCMGRIIGPLNVGERKAVCLQPFAHNGKIEAAYGDSKRDIPMLAMSLHPVAVCPDKALRQTALERGWRIMESGE